MRRIFTIILVLILITTAFFTVNVRADEEQLPDVQAGEEQFLDVQAGEEQLPDVQADEEQLSEVPADEEQLPEVQADEEQLPDIQQDEETLSDVQEEAESICDMQTDEAVFSDVKDPSRYYYDPVYWGVENGIIAGFSDGTFRPAAQCTRAQAVTFLWRMAGKPDPGTPSETFSDVDKSTSGYKAILWASKYKITGGYSDGTFRPNAACTREHMITFLWRYAGKPEPAGGENKFSDIFESDYYCKAVLWASENGIANGNTDGTFRPKAKCQRGHAAAFLYRYAQIFGTEPHLPEPEIGRAHV